MVNLFNTAAKAATNTKATQYKSTLRLSLLALALTGLIGCTVGPDYQAPTKLSQELNMPQLAPAAAARDNQQLTSWWQRFADAELNRLIDTALANNQTLAAAQANVDRAYAVFADSDDNNLPKGIPSLGYQANATPAEVSASGERVTSRQFQTGVGLSWDLDLFGKIKRASEVALADAQGAEFAWRDAQLTLVAQVAQSFGDYRGAALRLQVASQNLANLQQTTKLISARRDAGMASDLELSRVKAQTFAVETTLPDFQLAKRRAELTLAALLGSSVEALALDNSAFNLPELKTPQAVAKVNEQLQQRPDVAIAERRLAASTASIGVAKADLYPSLSVGGFIGFLASPDLAVGSAQKAWSVAPSLSWQGADWSSVQARINAANADEHAALATFRQTVLSALSEMQLSLDSYNLSRRQQLIQQQQLAATEQAVSLSQARFNAGNADFLELLDAQRELLAARDQQARLTQQNFSRLVDIYRSFGGAVLEG
ncbi:efflux transporter outer membrane subunit [Rheinheimera riviphila]|uniref:Efflux transporter outer membrane subunit n=1 Tax=Rheinheimera riviphila TaxID=1834037 RepID=A0A437QLF3_9GAMM|nr:efflux transporter outer membrane subunit [Rheinheimera riviphila]RVU35353.1 efflux transporter outer membrane subunit [Rheinheimera riviphila]